MNPESGPRPAQGRRRGDEAGAGALPPTRMDVLHSRQGTTLPRSCSSTSLYLRHFGLGHCTATTPCGVLDWLMAASAAGARAHWMCRLRTYSASRAISASDRPLLRWMVVRAILPLVMSRAMTSIRPLL